MQELTFSYSEVGSILSRYHVKRSSTKNNVGSAGGYSWQVNYSYDCKLCRDSNTRYSLDTGNTRVYAGYRGISDADKAHVVSLANHIFNDHGVVPCNICGELITQRGMKRHQNAPDCQGELRRHTMQTRGLSRLGPISANLIKNLVDNKAEMMEKLADWQDENILHEISQASSAAKHQLLTELEVKACYTQWDPKERRYQKEFWTHPITAHFIELVESSVDDEDEQLSVLNSWIYADENAKDAILGILELKKEGFT